MARFKVFLGRKPLREASFLAGPVVIGRQPDAQIQLDHAEVSRTHARVEKQQGRWVVLDTGRNGLTVNGDAVTERTLESGDTIEIAGFIIRFELTPEDAREDARSSPGAWSETSADGLARLAAKLSSRSAPAAKEARVQRLSALRTTDAMTEERKQQVQRMVEISKSAHVSWVASDGKKTITPLLDPGLLVGTAPGAHVRLRPRLLPIKEFAIIYREGEAVMLEPLSRWQKVTVNGIAIKRAARISNGDRIQVGEDILVFHDAMFSPAT
ncbi:MAG: FHA domain-containing protein [Myxococcota bacterium]